MWKGKPISVAGEGFVKREASAQSAKEDSPHGEDSQLRAAGKDHGVPGCGPCVARWKIWGFDSQSIRSDVV